MKEDLVHYVWQFRKYLLSPLKTTSGEPIEVLKPGISNPNAGPDFLEAKVKIGNTLWAGNVEIHFKTSDWFLHGHQEDEAFQNIILHVVYVHDTNTLPNNVPVLELQNYIPQNILASYQKLKQPFHFIPCEKQFVQVNKFEIENWLEHLFIQRLERKTQTILTFLSKANGDWEQVFFWSLAQALGLKVNAEPFVQWAQSFDFSLVRKNANADIHQLEALFLGQAGMLQADFQEEYPKLLKERYVYLQKKYQITPIPAKQFKFSRLRPPNFPSVRLAQLAAIYHTQTALFTLLLQMNYEQFRLFFTNIAASKAWNGRYTLDKISTKNHPKSISESLIQLIFINAFLPLKWAYHSQNGIVEPEDFWKELRQIPPEKNKITKSYIAMGANISDAFHSQAYLELNKYFCVPKKCLNCRIGNQLLHVDR